MYQWKWCMGGLELTTIPPSCLSALSCLMMNQRVRYWGSQIIVRLNNVWNFIEINFRTSFKPTIQPFLYENTIQSYEFCKRKEINNIINLGLIHLNIYILLWQWSGKLVGFFRESESFSCFLSDSKLNRSFALIIFRFSSIHWIWNWELLKSDSFKKSHKMFRAALWREANSWLLKRPALMGYTSKNPLTLSLGLQSLNVTPWNSLSDPPL